MFIGADKFSAEGLGLEASFVRKTKDGRAFLGLDLKRVNTALLQGRQMVCFLTKNPNLGKF
jgi:hypothetical protein